MKFKGVLSIVLALCMLLTVQSISVFAGSNDEAEETENIVTLFAAFNDFEGEEMTTEDNKNFFLSTKLDAGSYQFSVDENGQLLGHSTTVKETTARISAKGLELSENVDARCTLLSTGGDYTFEYNTDTNLLNIRKAGTGTPADSGKSLKVKANTQEITANVGEKFTYNVYLKADEIFEDIQFVLNFDHSKLSLTDTTVEKCCPLLFEPIFNIDNSGFIAANSSKIDGYDLKAEKLLLTAEFTVTGTGEAYVDFIIQDMTILGGEKSYFFLSCEKENGADLREELKANTVVVPTSTASDPAETTTSVDTAPLTTPASTSTTPSEGTTETTVPATSGSSGDEETTVYTEPSETVTTSPVSQFELGDVNRDGKLNIRDATLIQKALAKLEQLDNEQLILADYLADGKVNIKDATQIQKKIANLL